VEVTTKNGRKIYGCPNWRVDGKGCPGTIYDPNHEESRKRIYPRVAIRYNVASRSEPGKFWTVEIYEDGSMRDNCIAGDMQKFCWHQKKAGKWLKDLVRLMEKVNNIDFDKVELEKPKKNKDGGVAKKSDAEVRNTSEGLETKT